MRVFVSEYICGGAWPEKTLDGSLPVEGRAMLVALVEDLLHASGLDVVITWDGRLSAFPVQPSARLKIVQVSSLEGEAREFKRLCHDSDAVVVIAPEFHGILASRIETASTVTGVVGCDSEATRLCSDKLRLAEFLTDAGIPTIPTERFDLAHSGENDRFQTSVFPCVIKPRDGAGSTLTRKVSNADELAALSDQFCTAAEGFEFIRQPFVEGLAVSCAAIVTAGQGGEFEPSSIDVLPPVQQMIADDGRFGYLGADYPGLLPPADIDRIENLARRCCQAISGLRGYVGFDLLIPNKAEQSPVVVEINPRLTTGYLLWRKMCVSNLAVHILESCLRQDSSAVEPLCWNPENYSFRTDSFGE